MAASVLSPPRSRLILERVLGLTARNNAMMVVNPVSGELAYAAGCIVVIYNLRRNKQVRYYRVDKSVSCLCFSPNGQYLAIGEKGYLPAITIWDGTDGTLCAELQRHQYGVACMAFSQDGHFLLSVGLVHDQDMYAWELKVKKKDAARRLEVAAVGCALVQDKVLGIDYCQAGNFFVTVGEKHFKYWFLDDKGAFLVTGLQVNELPELQHRDAVVNAKTLATFTGVGCGQGSCELKTFAVTLDGTLCCFGASGIMERLVSLEATCGNAISVTESYVAVGGSSGVVRLFNPTTLEYCTTLPFPPAFGAANEPLKITSTSSSALYPTDPFRYPAAIATRITGSHVIVLYSDRSIFIYDATNPNAVTAERSFLYHSGGIRGLQVVGAVRGINAKGKVIYSDGGSTDGATGDIIPTGTFVTCSDDNTARLWNLELHRRPAKSNRFESADAENESWKNPFSQEMLRVIYNDHERDFDDEDGSVLGGTCSHKTSYSAHSPVPAHGRNKGLQAIAVRPDRREIVCGDQEGNVVVIPLPLEKPLIRIGAHSSKVHCLTYNRRHLDGKMLMASGGNDRLVQLFDCERGHTVLSTLESHSAAVSTVSLSCDGRKLVSCGTDNVVLVSEIDLKGKVLDSKRLPFTSGKIFDVTLLSDGDTVVACCNDKLEVRSASTGKVKQMYPVGQQRQIAVCPANFCVAMSGSLAENTIHVVDITTGETLATGTGHGEVITALAFTPDCRRLLSSSSDGCIFVWRLADDIQTEIKARLPRITETPSLLPASPHDKDEEAVLPPPAPPASRLAKPQVVKNLELGMNDKNANVVNTDKKTMIPKWKGKGMAVPGPMANIPMEDWMRTRATAKPTIHVVEDLAVQVVVPPPLVPSPGNESPRKDKHSKLSMQALGVETLNSSSLALEREQLEKRKKQMDTANAVAAMTTRLSRLGLLKPLVQPTPTLQSLPANSLQLQTLEKEVLEIDNSSGAQVAKLPVYDEDTVRAMSVQVIKSLTSSSDNDSAPSHEVKSIISDGDTSASAVKGAHSTSFDDDTELQFQATECAASRCDEADKVTTDLVSQALQALNDAEPPRPLPVDIQVDASLSVHTTGYDSRAQEEVIGHDEGRNKSNGLAQAEVNASLSAFTNGFVAASSIVDMGEAVASSLSVFTAGYGTHTQADASDEMSSIKTHGLTTVAEEMPQLPVDVSLSGFLNGYGTVKDIAIGVKESGQPPTVEVSNDGTLNVDMSAVDGTAVSTDALPKATLDLIINLCQSLDTAATGFEAIMSSQVLRDPELQEIQTLVMTLRSAIAAKLKSN